MALSFMRNMKYAKGPTPSMPWRRSSSVIIAAPKTKTPEPTELCKGLEINDSADYRICMLKRSSKSSFMKNAMVFPGGSFEEVDKRLAEKYGVKPDVICCLREAFEEAGAALLANGATGSREWQEKVQSNSSEYENFVNYHKTSPAVDKMHYWCSFQTPDVEAARVKKGGFDTTFYLTTTDLTNSDAMQCDGKETVSLVWVSPQEAIVAYLDGRIWLPPPQYHILEELSGKPLINGLDAYADSPERAFTRNHPIKPCVLIPTDFNPATDKAKVCMAFPGDALHANYPHPGGLHRVHFGRNPTKVTKLFENIKPDLVIPFHGKEDAKL
eukprot:TRINITY_DN2164_c0_g1_i1.p1 TRINITY_DN2164_c0_g1~~TRINITY_DN2164_c0_g1_i1.p1  ORF type:complete len:327 (+),score=46.72 TRINITY_DN2164_c0_g1_i1:45-1025(+)